MVVDLISKAIGAEKVFVDEPMAFHTTFKIGGSADILIEPANKDEIIETLKILKQFDIPYFVMGNGSNILVSDKGIRGAVIKISKLMQESTCSANTIKAGAGIKLSRIANTALNNSLTGFEFAGGIPGTLGGALFMNAGAYGGEMKDVVKEVTYIDTDTLEINTVSGDMCEFGYRKSIFSRGNTIITDAEIELSKGNYDEIKAKMSELSNRRCEKQPLEKPSAGSTFKRPEGYFAGALIQQSNLMGYRIGGAMVSTKHAGFVINEDKATAEDVLNLIEHIKTVVYKNFKVELEPEVRLVGEF